MHVHLNLALRLQHNRILCSLQGTWTLHPTLHGYNWAPKLSEAHDVFSWSKAKKLDWLGYFSFKILSGTWLNFLEIQCKLASVIENLTASTQRKRDQNWEAEHLRRDPFSVCLFCPSEAVSPLGWLQHQSSVLLSSVYRKRWTDPVFSAAPLKQVNGYLGALTDMGTEFSLQNWILA